MPIATPEKYAEMLDAAKAKSFAFPAINVSSSQTLNAALAGFAEAGSDGIIQVSTGGAEYLSGPTVKDMVTGSVAFAAYAAEVAKNYPVNIALHTDHCPKDKLDGFVRPLLAISLERVKNGQDPLFQSHMWDGSAVPLEENLRDRAGAARPGSRGARSSSRSRSASSAARRTASRAVTATSSTAPPRTRWPRSRALGTGENGRYLTALTFGNVHGVYKPGNVKLRPEILKKAQEAVVEKLGLDAGREAVRPGLPRRLRLDGRGDRRRGRLRRDQDERRHRHPVRLHPPRRRPHVHQLRRRAQGRRRGRQQEGLRPARLGQGRRGRHGRPASSRPARTCAAPATRSAEARPALTDWRFDTRVARRRLRRRPLRSWRAHQVLRAGEGDRGEEADDEDGRGQQHRLRHRVAERREHLRGEVATAGLARLEVQALRRRAGSPSAPRSPPSRARRRPAGWRCRRRPRRRPGASAGCGWRWRRWAPR